jgi:hypothetical protein
MNERVNESVASAEKNHIELSMDYSSEQHATKGATFLDRGITDGSCNSRTFECHLVEI